MKKVSKQSVNYKEATTSKRCGNCVMFRGDACTLVAGVIQSSKVCDEWAAKRVRKTK